MSAAFEFKLNAPFVMKTSFYQATHENKAKNVAHLSYIANRPGVELSQLDLRESADKNVDDILRELKPNTPQGHVKYIDERPNSHGLFGPSGSEDIKKVQKELAQHSGVVWRKILSLREDDAHRLGYVSRDAWESMLKKTVPLAAASMGIKESNLRWAAAYHHEKGHPHVHLMIWEKTPWRRRGILSHGEMKDIKKEFVNEIYQNERFQLTQERTAMRNAVYGLSKENIEEIVNEIGSLTKIKELKNKAKAVIFPKRMYEKDEKQLVNELRELAKMMPGQGRVAFNYMPEDVKEKTLEITRALIRKPQFSEFVRRYMKATEGLSKTYTQYEPTIDRARKRALIDLEKRVSQVVLRGAAQINYIDRGKAFKNQQIAMGVWNGIQQGIQKNISEQEHMRNAYLRELQWQSELEEKKNKQRER